MRETGREVGECQHGEFYYVEEGAWCPWPCATLVKKGTKQYKELVDRGRRETTRVGKFMGADVTKETPS